MMCSVAAVAIAPSASRASKEIPRYDPGRVAGFGGDYCETTRSSCMNMQQGAYDAFKPRCAEISSRIREYSDEVTRFGGEGRSTNLKSCIHMGRSVATLALCHTRSGRSLTVEQLKGAGQRATPSKNVATY